MQRPVYKDVYDRLNEPRRTIVVLSGPRQVGKTTLINQLEASGSFKFVRASADETFDRKPMWITVQWENARRQARDSNNVVLAIDEVQKISDWSEVVKAEWDKDTRSNVRLKVILLGSSPLFAVRGISETLAGRYEVIRIRHWTLAEMQQAFHVDLQRFLIFGSYPGSVPYMGDEERWRTYIRDSIVEASISRDILTSWRIDKPALLRQLFGLGCEYGGQILSYTKMLGQLHDAGNTTTLAHYLEILSQCGLIAGVQKFASNSVRKRASSPKLLVLNQGFISAAQGLSAKELSSDPERWGRIVENAVGAHIWNSILGTDASLYYWADGNHELDFVVQKGDQILALEVKSGRRRKISGLNHFLKLNGSSKPMVIGSGGVDLEEFLKKNVLDYF